ncbi:hypothetical protein GOODEAATRI_001095 [Goodea atripinnis]|uniref:Uncharacterized protein n=1 Tax=Goodea atripinnis TaxID=208336 RepID=A0ABV0MXX3_9TELE
MVCLWTIFGFQHLNQDISRLSGSPSAASLLVNKKHQENQGTQHAGEEKKPYNMLLPPPCLTVVMLHSPHSARPGQEHSWPDLVEPVDRRMERSPPRARFLRKHAQVWGL